MEKKKQNKEIFEQKYPFKDLEQSPMLCAEAVGYLKALIQYFPSEQKWVEAEIATLRLVLLFYTL